MAVVITVPHAYCPVPCSYERLCDCKAKHWATQLSAKLEEAGIAVQLLAATTPRSKGDFNRIWTRNSPYRQSVRHALDTARLVLDIHSYPRLPWPEYDAIVLDDRWPQPRSLLEFSAATGLPADIRGANNDIQDEAHARGIEAFLIEFNEQGNVAKQEQIVEKIVAWCKTL